MFWQRNRPAQDLYETPAFACAVKEWRRLSRGDVSIHPRGLLCDVTNNS